MNEGQKDFEKFMRTWMIGYVAGLNSIKSILSAQENYVFNRMINLEEDSEEEERTFYLHEILVDHQKDLSKIIKELECVIKIWKIDEEKGE